MIGCRFKLYRKSDRVLVFTEYLGADTNDDILEAIDRWKAHYASQPIGDVEVIVQDLFIKLDKDNVLLLLNGAAAIPPLQTGILQAWFDYASFPQLTQEFLDLVRAMIVEKSPRKTWAHGH